MVCWTRPRNLREILIRAKLPKIETNRRSSRNKFGFKHCGRNCNMCKHSPNFVSYVVCSKTNEKIPIVSNLTCLSKNVIYCITCDKQGPNCSSKPQYIGETGRMIASRFNEHRSSVKPGSKTSIGKHFSEDGHSSCNMKIIPFEQIRSTDPWVRVSREKFYIRKFDAALNRKI